MLLPVQAAHAVAAEGTLLAGQSIPQDTQTFTSASGRYHLQISNADIQIREIAGDPGGVNLPTWAEENTAGRSYPGTSFLTLQSDGNLVFYNQAGSPLWNSGTRGSQAAQLVLQNDGNLVLYRANGTPVWATYSFGRFLAPGETLAPGQALYSVGNPEYPNQTLIMQTDGNLVLYSSKFGPLWWSSSFVPGSRLIMQTDGNLVIYSPSGQPLGWTGTQNATGREFLDVGQGCGFGVFGPQPGATELWGSDLVRSCN